MRLSYYIKNFNELSNNKVGIVNINIKNNKTVINKEYNIFKQYLKK